LLSLLIKEIKKLYPDIIGTDEEIVSSRNWQDLTLETGDDSVEKSLLKIIELRKENVTELAKNQRQLTITQQNISKIKSSIEIKKSKSKDEIFKLADLQIDSRGKENYNSIYNEYFRNEDSLLELTKRYKIVFSNIVPIFKDDEALQFFPFFKNNYRIFLGTYGAPIWEIYRYTTVPERVNLNGMKKILIDYNFRITHELDDDYRERFIFPKKTEDYIYFLKVNKNINVLEYHLLNTNKHLLPELFIFYKKFYGDDFMNWFNLYATLTESNQILYHQKPNIMSTFILSNSINILKKIYEIVNELTLEVLIRPERDHKASIEKSRSDILKPDNFRDITDIDDNYAYLDSILKSIKTTKFPSEVHKIFFVLKRISINKTFKFKSIFLFINYLLQSEKSDEEGQAPTGGASSSSETPVSSIKINLPQVDRIRIRDELIIILNLIKNSPEINLQEIDINRLVHSYNFLGINAKYIESIGWLSRNEDTFYKNIKELNTLIKLSSENVSNLLFINLLEEAYYYKCLKSRINPLGNENTNFIEVIFMFFYFNNLNTNVILKNLTNLNLQLCNLLQETCKDILLNKDGVISHSNMSTPEEKLTGQFYKILYFNTDYLVGLKFMDYKMMYYKFNDPRGDSRITNSGEGRPMCGEVTLMNFLNSMLWNATDNKLDITYFPDTTKPELVEFYRKNESKLNSFNTKPIYEEFFNLLKNIPFNLSTNYEMIPLASNIRSRDYGDANLKTPYRYYDLKPRTQIINTGVEFRLSYYNICRVLSYLLNLSDELSFDNIQRLDADGNLVLMPENLLQVSRVIIPAIEEATDEEIAQAERLAEELQPGGGADRGERVKAQLAQILAKRPGAGPPTKYSTLNKFTLRNIIDKFKNPNKLKFISTYKLISEGDLLYAVDPIKEVSFDFLKFTFGTHSSEVLSGVEKQNLKIIMENPLMGKNIYRNSYSTDIGQAFYQSKLKGTEFLKILYENCPDSHLINYFNILNQEEYISKRILMELIFARKINVLYFIFERFNIYDKKVWIKFIMLLLDMNIKDSYEKYIKLYFNLLKKDKFNTKELTIILSENIEDDIRLFRNRFDKIQEFLNIKDIPFIGSLISSKLGRGIIDYIYTKLGDNDFNINTLKFLFYTTSEINYDRLFGLVKSDKLNFNDIFEALDFSSLLNLYSFYDFNFKFDYDKIMVFFRDPVNEKYLWKGGLIFRNLFKNKVYPPQLDDNIKLLGFIVRTILRNINNEENSEFKVRKEKQFKKTFKGLILELFSNKSSLKQIGFIPFRKINMIFEKINEIKNKKTTEEEKNAYENGLIDIPLLRDAYIKLFKDRKMTIGMYKTLGEPFVLQLQRLMTNLRLTETNVFRSHEEDLFQKYLKYKNKYQLLKKLKI
jgi:hypothetical protein